MVNKNVYQVNRKVIVFEYFFVRCAMRMTIEAERVWLMVLVQLQQNRIAMQAAA
jgi:hypothetical protein